MGGHVMPNCCPTIKVSIAQNNKPFLTEVRDALGFGQIYPVGRRGYQLQITRAASVLTFLQLVEPWVRIKAEQVVLGIELASLVGRCGGVYRVDPAVVTRRWELHRLLKQLKNGE